MPKINKTNWTRPAAKLKTNMTKEEANELIHGLLASHYIAPLTHQAIRDKLIAALAGKEE